MKYLFAFLAMVGLVTTGVSSQKSHNGGDRDCRHHGPPPDPFMQLFDTNQDDQISKEEMDQSASVLQNLDRDQNGSLSREELPRPPRPPRPPHSGDRPHRHPEHRQGPPPERGHQHRPDHRDSHRRGGPQRPHHERPDMPDRGPENNRPPRPEQDHFEHEPQSSSTENAPTGTVVFRGGYETDPRDHGRPVNLIAAALGVKPQVFRDAFSNVRPARNGAPSEMRARANKQVLLDALGKHGITNERLDTVSNYYRYQPHQGETWKHTPAKATAIIKDGKVTGFKITNPGSGYSSPPRITVAGHENLQVTAELKFSQNFQENGSIKSLKITE